jgi:hypothetical protein
MSDGERKREGLFHFYADHLQLLAKENMVSQNFLGKTVYICPICLSEFSSANGGDNPLTLEDAPPKSLGGTANVLTCKKCNNTAGYKIDFHLTERLQEMDSQKFLPGTELDVKAKIGSETFRATIMVDDEGTMRIFHSKKNNHPEKLEAAMATLKKGNVVDTEFLKSRVIPTNLEYALLKTGYLLAFRKFGYSLMLDHCYDDVRSQLQDPETSIYPTGFWFTPPASSVVPGVFFIMDEEYEALFVVFSVATSITSHIFATVLPLPIRPVEEVINRLTERFTREKTFSLTLYPLEQDSINYLTDIANIKAMKDWIVKRKKEYVKQEEKPN